MMNCFLTWEKLLNYFYKSNWHFSTISSICFWLMHLSSVRLAIWLSIQLCICHSIYPYVCLSVSLFSFSSIHLCVCTSLCLPIPLSVHLSVHLSAFSSLCVTICHLVHPSVCHFDSLSVCVLFCLSVHLYKYPSAYYESDCLSISVCLPICQYV